MTNFILYVFLQQNFFLYYYSQNSFWIIQMSEKDGGDATPQNAQDLTVFVQSLLEQMVGIIFH